MFPVQIDMSFVSPAKETFYGSKYMGVKYTNPLIYVDVLDIQ